MGNPSIIPDLLWCGWDVGNHLLYLIYCGVGGTWVTHGNPSIIPPVDKLKERIDFMLRESLTENSYINSLTAHFSYWTAQDCAKYLLLQIYRYNPQE